MQYPQRQSAMQSQANPIIIKERRKDGPLFTCGASPARKNAAFFIFILLSLALNRAREEPGTQNDA